MEDLLSSKSYIQLLIIIILSLLLLLLLPVYEDIGDGIKVIVELLKNDTRAAHDNSVETITLGTISIPQDCSWVLMDNKICDIFQVSGK